MVRIIITGDNHLNLYNQKLGSRLTERRNRIGQAWWKTIDYAASNLYDYQSYFHDPDGFDARLAALREATWDKPFLALFGAKDPILGGADTPLIRHLAPRK